MKNIFKKIVPAFAAIICALLVGGVAYGITPYSIFQGGSGASTQQGAINNLTAVSSATNEHVLTKDTSTGNAIWKATKAETDPVWSAAAANYLLATGATTGATSQAQVFTKGITANAMSTFAGNVGIGTTSPLGKLHVVASDTVPAIYYGMAAADNQIISQIGSNIAWGWKWLQNESSTGDMYLQARNASVDSNVMYFKRSNGNVGIGTTAPNVSLETNGIVRAARSGTATQYVQINGGDSNGMYLTATPSNGQAKPFLINNAGNTSTTDRNIQFQIAGSTAMTIASSGNVGIGTAAPTAVLHLKAGTASASTAPLKFTSGTLLTAPEAGAVEFLTDAFYGTITTGTARKQFAFTDSNITGSAATLTTPRAIYGNNFDGSAALTQVIASTYGGTGNGFVKFSGPTTSEKTFTLPNSDATLLYSGGALGTPASGTVTNLTGTASININGTVGATTPTTGVFTTVNGLTLTSAATGFTIAGGTTSKTLTLSGDATVNQSVDTTASPSFSSVNATSGYKIGSATLGVWNRQGALIVPSSSSDDMNVAEATLIAPEGDPLILTQYTTVWKMWFSTGWSNANVYYAESADGINWTRYTSPSVSGVARPFVVKSGSTYYMYAAPTGDTQINEYTSVNGRDFSLSHSAVITTGAGGSWNASNVNNCSGVIDSGTLYLFVEGVNGSGTTSIGLFTSTDFYTFSEGGSNPVISGKYNGGPTVPMKVGSTWYIYTHGGSAGYPSKIWRYTSPSLTGSWTLSPETATFEPTTYDEGVNNQYGQVVDPFIIEVGSKTYLFYTGGNDYRYNTGFAKIKLAIADMPFSSLVGTNEGVNTGTAGNLGVFLPTVNGLTVGTGTNNLAKNTAVGFHSLFGNNSGNSGNTSVGYESLLTNTSGANNTAIGLSSGYTNSTGNGNVFIGANSGKYETGSNAFYVDNQDRTNTAGDKTGALLYGTFNADPGSQTLKINGVLTTPYAINMYGDAEVYGAHAFHFWNSANNSGAYIWNSGSSGDSEISLGYTTKIANGGVLKVPTAYSGTVGATNRDLYVDDTGLIGYVSSSIRYKENVVSLTGSERIYDLRPVSFTYKKDGGKGIGLIAEEVEKVMTELVSYDKEGKPETVQYSQLPTYLLAEIQKLNKRIGELEAKCGK